MAEMKSEETSEKKSLNFIEQIVENDLKEGKTEEEYRHVFRQSLTAIFTSDTLKQFASILALQLLMVVCATCALTTPTRLKKM